MLFKNLKVGEFFTCDGGVFKRVRQFDDNGCLVQALIIEPVLNCFCAEDETPAPAGEYTPFNSDTEVMRLRDYVEGTRNVH